MKKEQLCGTFSSLLFLKQNINVIVYILYKCLTVAVQKDVQDNV